MVALTDPDALETVKDTSCKPGVLYVIVGIESVEVEGVPPGKVQLQLVGLPFHERSVNVKLSPWQTALVELLDSKSALHNTAGVLTPVAVKLEEVQRLLLEAVLLVSAVRILVFCPVVNIVEQ